MRTGDSTVPYLAGLFALGALGGCTESFSLDDGGVASLDASFSAADAGAAEADAGAPMADAGPVACGPDERRRPLVYYGTAEPTAMPLTPGQVLAVVDFDGCSGAFVTDEWVLTAEHCGVRVGRELCVGPDAADADRCFTVDRVEDHPSVDMSLVHVDAPASTRVAELEPIPIMTETVDPSWIGRTAEAAGYGSQEDGSIGEREFTAEPIVALEGPFVVIDGMGERGVCFGDSGGPLMVLASDATVRVLGALSYGDPSCVGRDSFTRTDLQREWLEAILGPIVVDGAPCGRITPGGDCLGASSAVWCDEASGLVTSETCAEGTACGWDVDVLGYRCVTDDPCMGVSAAGACQGDTAVWCDEGTLRRRECGACDHLCRYDSDVRGFDCRPDPCVGHDPQGECDGTVLTLCDSDEGVLQVDCARYGRVCGYSSRRGRNGCVRG